MVPRHVLGAVCQGICYRFQMPLNTRPLFFWPDGGSHYYFLGRLPELVADVKFCVAWSANPSPSFGTRHPPYRRTCLSPFTLTTLKITSLVFQTSATTALAQTVDRSILPGTRKPNNIDWHPCIITHAWEAGNHLITPCDPYTKMRWIVLCQVGVWIRAYRSFR